MEDRIGTLHLDYRVSGSTSLGQALVPGFDRAVRAGLADALGARMAAMLGEDASVIVIRELSAPVVLDKADCALDARVVERICRSAGDALTTMLSRDPPEEAIVRFADEAEFVGSFILDLIAGAAWERWHYGAFRRYRRADAKTTIRAVLAESGAEVARVLAWLARRGQLDAVLSLLTPRDARRLLGSGAAGVEAADVGNGNAVLVDAALRLLSDMGWRGAESSGRSAFVAQFLASRPIAPDWTDRRSLSAWVLALVQFALAQPEWDTPARQTDILDAVRASLSGPLDWLDAPWLTAELAALTQAPAPEPMRTLTPSCPLLTPRHDRILQQLARRLRDGRLRILSGESEDALVVRLIAAASEEAAGREPLDQTLVAAIEEVARAYVAIAGSDAPRRHAVPLDDDIRLSAVDRSGTLAPDVARCLEARRAAGESAVELLRAAVAARPKEADSGALTRAAGVFLPARAVLDVRLQGLAREFDIALPPLLGGLASKWLGLPLSADRAVSLWAGAERPDPAELDPASERLGALGEALLQLLIDRRTLDAATAHEVIASDAALLTQELDCSPETNAGLSNIASMLLRAWARWLPGIGSSSAPFLLDNCVRRAGRVGISETKIAVQLAPAPLDVVVQMAGYFAPIERVAWLADRTVTFTVRPIPDGSSP